MSRHPRSRPLPILLALGIALACGKGTGVDSLRDTGAPAARPVRAVVQRFATTAELAARQPGKAPQLADALKGERLTTAEDLTGRALARALADELVIRIREIGLPARHEAGKPAGEDEIALFGQLLSVWPDPPGERAALGVRAERSALRTRVQIYGSGALLREFEVLTAGKGRNVGEGFSGGRSWTPTEAPARFGPGLEDPLRGEAWSILRRTVDQVAALVTEKGWIVPPPLHTPQSEASDPVEYILNPILPAYEPSFPPRDVRMFLGRATRCETWRDFHVFDERSRQVRDENVARYCPGIDEEREMLERRHADDPRILSLLSAWAPDEEDG
jgi:hypothetical protein